MMTNGDRIRQAREISGMTQDELAKSLGLSQAQIALLEQNLRQPREETLAMIAIATGFPLNFFRRTTSPELPLGSFLYRKRKSMTSRDRDRTRQFARLILDANLLFAGQFKDIELKLPRVSGATPEDAARITRAELGFALDTPITNLITRLERNGVLVLPVPVDIDEHDAFSVWADTEPRKPVIVMTAGKPGDRQRWSLAHELGHLVMHYTYTASLPEIENQANLFGAEFLMPEETARKNLRGPLTLTLLAELKARWGISIQALIMRAFQLGIITDGQRRYLFRQLASRGWLKNEPVSIPPEKPRLLRKMIEATYGCGFDPKIIGDSLGVPTNMISEILDNYRSAPSQPRESAPRSTARLLTMQPRVRLA